MPKRILLGAWCVILGVIAWASLSPPSNTQGGQAGGDPLLANLGHVPAYTLLTMLTLWLAQSRCASRLRTAALAAPFGLGIGVLFELVQPLVGRDGNLKDVTLNGLGVGLALIAWSHGWLARPHTTSR